MSITDAENRWALNRLTCRTFGHRPDNVIVGFRDRDGAALVTCFRCLEQVAHEALRASPALFNSVKADQ